MGTKEEEEEEVEERLRWIINFTLIYIFVFEIKSVYIL